MDRIANSVLNLDNSQESESSFDSLKIASLNVNSLISLSKRNDLYNFVSDNNFDIVLLCETKLNPRYKIQFSQYDLTKTDRPKSQKGGGTAIMIKKNIPYAIVYNPASNNNSIIEYTIIKIKLAQFNFFIIALYANNKESRAFTAELNHLFHNLNLDAADIIIIPDIRRGVTELTKEKVRYLKNGLTMRALVTNLRCY